MRPQRFAKYVLLVLLALGPPSASIADIYAMVMADTVSPTGKAAHMDLERIRLALTALARHSGNKVHVSTFIGDQVTSGTLLGAMQALPIMSNDAVIFYYLGHGYRTSTKDSVWPYLYLCNDETSLDFKIALEAIIAKRPRMALVVADCCNNVMDDETMAPWEGHSQLKKRQKSPAAGYKALFNNFQGIVVVCASKAGDYAYCHSHGHFYTDAFLRALHEEIYHPNPQWTTLLNRAGLKVQHLQQPYYEILSYP